MSLQTWLPAAAEQFFQITLLITVTLTISRPISTRWPRLVHGLWCLVLIKCIVPPLWDSPTSIFAWMPAEVNPAPASDLTDIQVKDFTRTALEPGSPDKPVMENSQNKRAQPPSETTASLVTSSDPFWRAAESADPWEDLAVSVSASDASDLQASTMGGSVQSESVVVEPSPPGARWAAWVLGIWAMGSIVSFSIRLRRALRFRRMVEASELPPSETVVLRFAELRRRVGAPGRTRLLVTGSRLGPAAMGVVSPRVVIPAVVVERDGQAGCGGSQVDAVLIHELMHLRRRDVWIGWLQVVATSLWWFHPLVWWASFRLSQSTEVQCDRDVILKTDHKPAGYARSLLEVIRVLAEEPDTDPWNETSWKNSPVVLGFRGMNVTRIRMERIMKTSTERNANRWLSAIIIFAVAAMVLPGAVDSVAQENGNEKSVADAPRPWEFIHQGVPSFSVRTKLMGDSVAIVEAGGDTFTFLDEPSLQGNSDRAAQPRAVSEPMIAKTYDLSAFVKKYSRDQRHQEEVKDSVESDLRGWLSISFDDPHRRLAWTGTTLHVFAGASDQKKIADAIEKICSEQRAQIAVETQMFRCDYDKAKQLLSQFDLAWYLMPTRETKDPAGVVEYSSLRRRHLSGGKQAGIWSARVRRQREAIVPLFTATVTAEQLDTIRDAWQETGSKPVDSMPKVTLFEGQYAVVQSTSLRPFVVGVHSTGEEQPEAAVNPTVQVLQDGFELGLLGRIVDRGRIVLQTAWTMSAVENVDVMKVASARHNDIAVQAPEVIRDTVTTTIETEPEKSVLLASIRPSSDGRSQFVMLALTCTRADSEETPIVPAKAADRAANSAPQRMVRLSGFPSLVQDENEKVRTWRQLPMSSPMDEVMSTLGVTVEAAGMKSFDVRDDRAMIEADTVRVVYQQGNSDKKPIKIVTSKLAMTAAQDAGGTSALRMSSESDSTLRLAIDTVVQAESIHLEISGQKQAKPKMLLEASGTVQINRGGMRMTGKATKLQMTDDGLLIDGNEMRIESKSTKH